MSRKTTTIRQRRRRVRCDGPRVLLVVSVWTLGCLTSWAGAQEKITAIQGGDLYTITSGIIRNGTLLIENGKISSIGQGIEIPKDAQVIDAKGKVVLPGFVAATTRVTAMSRFRDINKIADSLDPFHYSVSLATASGVTTAFLTTALPRYYGESGGRPDNPIGGANAVVKMTYGELDNMLMREPVAETVNISGAQWLRKANFVLGLRKARAYLHKRAEYEKAKDGKKVPEPAQPDDIDPYLRLLRRELPARVEVTTAPEIRAALELVDEFGIRMILEGGVEAWIVAEEIARREAYLVFTPREKQEPNKEISGPSGSNLEAPAILKKAGVKFAIVPTNPSFGSLDAGRDLMALPMEAAAAVSGGLDEPAALAAITLTPAEILGVADRVGSLQVGKDADIVILDGHPFHYRSFVELTLVNGKVVYDKKRSTYFSHVTNGS
jgi:imidazolonepropionase-like amidohydrolase